MVVGSVGGEFSLGVVMGTNLWWFYCGGGGFVVVCLGFVASGVGFRFVVGCLDIVVSGGFQWWWALIWGWICCGGGCGFCYGGRFARRWVLFFGFGFVVVVDLAEF